MKVSDQFIICSECSREVAMKAAFDHADRSWPEQGLVSFTCPECDEWNQVSVETGAVSEGGIDGAPGPCFIESRRIEASDLRVMQRDDGIELHAGKLRWVVPRKA